MLTVADNSGAKILQCFHVMGGTGRRYAAVGDVIVGAVKDAEPRKLVKKHDVVRAVIIRQKKEMRRPNGMRVSFDDNAVVIVDEKNEPKGTEIKGPIAREVAERFPKLGSMATIIV